MLKGRNRLVVFTIQEMLLSLYARVGVTTLSLYVNVWMQGDYLFKLS